MTVKEMMEAGGFKSDSGRWINNKGEHATNLRILETEGRRWVIVGGRDNQMGTSYRTKEEAETALMAKAISAITEGVPKNSPYIAGAKGNK